MFSPLTSVAFAIIKMFLSALNASTPIFLFVQLYIELHVGQDDAKSWLFLIMTIIINDYLNAISAFQLFSIRRMKSFHPSSFLNLLLE